VETRKHIIALILYCRHLARPQVYVTDRYDQGLMTASSTAELCRGCGGVAQPTILGPRSSFESQGVS
jgi:hypothetical protein